MAEMIYSPGLEGVIAGETAVCTISGGLSYRGYSIDDLCENATFEEVAYLLLENTPPDSSQLKKFKADLAENYRLDPQLEELIRKLPSDIPMMDYMRTAVSLVAHFDREVGDDSPEASLRKATRLVAQLPILLAFYHRLRQGKEPLEPRAEDSYAKNLLRLLTGKEPTAAHIKAMDVSLILYAEHEFNASTFATRIVCSTLSDLHSAITAGVGTLKGPLHGGANERVMEVLSEVGSSENAPSWVSEALAQKRRIMGFGHRVYKEGDPRAKILKAYCVPLANETNNQEMETIADIIEQAVSSEKGLPPNLDWPSARLYYYMGLPIDIYTPLFVLSRVTGWSAHYLEQQANNRLIRPRSKYTGKEGLRWPAN
ncbi:MAG: citrate synthase [Pirellulaceae bacterium]|nr:citrate synthase [Pirellulaceae bacterium]